MLLEKIYCPVNGWSCPYFGTNGRCMLNNPRVNCDDFAAMAACLEDNSDTIYIFGSIE